MLAAMKHTSTRGLVGVKHKLRYTKHNDVVLCIAKKFVLPSLQYLVNHMRPLVHPGKSLFFSGPGDYEFKARLYAHEHGLKVLSDLTDPAMTEAAADIGGRVQKEYWRLVSTAYSEVTTGPAYLLLPGDPRILRTAWHKGTLWDTVEWPILKKSSDVTGVFRLNPSMILGEAVNIRSSPP
jgi:hypothetical protein